MQTSQKETSASYNVREQHFAVKHHDTVGPFVEIMLDVFTTCQFDKTGPHVDLEIAHDHVFGNASHKPCDWCSSTFQRRRDYQKEFFA